jgi:hypothetical protein
MSTSFEGDHYAILSNLSFHPSVFRPYIPLSILFSNTIFSLCSSFNVRTQVSHTYKTAGEMMFLSWEPSRYHCHFLMLANNWCNEWHNLWFYYFCLIQQHFQLWRTASSGILRRVALVRTDVSEELSASFIRMTRISELGTTVAVTSNSHKLWRNAKWERKLVWNSELRMQRGVGVAGSGMGL